MEAISTAVAAAYRASATVEFGTGCPTLVNSRELGQLLGTSLRETLNPRMVLSAADLGGSARGGGSEDFAYISQEVPSVMLALAAGGPEQGCSYPQHHPKVRFDERVLSTGAAALVSCGFLELPQAL